MKVYERQEIKIEGKSVEDVIFCLTVALNNLDEESRKTASLYISNPYEDNYGLVMCYEREENENEKKAREKRQEQEQQSRKSLYLKLKQEFGDA